MRPWGALDAWIRAHHVFFGTAEPIAHFWETQAEVKPPWRGLAPSQALASTGRTNAEANLRFGPGVDSWSPRTVAAGVDAAISSRATDDQSSAWYRVVVGGDEGWIHSPLVDLHFTDPLRPVGGRPLASLVEGKGMRAPMPHKQVA